MADALAANNVLEVIIKGIQLIIKRDLPLTINNGVKIIYSTLLITEKIIIKIKTIKLELIL